VAAEFIISFIIRNL